MGTQRGDVWGEGTGFPEPEAGPALLGWQGDGSNSGERTGEG